jgi:hypothetical protein
MEALSDWLESFKYDHPGIYRIFVVIFSISVLLIGFMMLPDSPMLKAMGINGVQKRISATANGIYWSTRASISQAGNPEHTQQYGNLEGVDPKGKIIVSVPDHDKWIRKSLALANAEITDMYGAAQIVGSLRTENARFDIYGQDRVVIWIRNAPLNVKLIEAGVAKPDANPLTNIFDIAFATYYWGEAKGPR